MKRMLLAGAASGGDAGCRAGGRQDRDGRGLDPGGDHGWTGGVVFQAERAKGAARGAPPGLKYHVKTSPDGASQANALEDLTPRASTRSSRCRRIRRADRPDPAGEWEGRLRPPWSTARSRISRSRTSTSRQQPGARPGGGRVHQGEDAERHRGGDPRPADCHRRGAAEGLRRGHQGQRCQGAWTSSSATGRATTPSR